MPLLFAAIFVAFSLLVPGFLSVVNLQGLMLSVSLIGTIAATMMLVLALGEVDLSVGSIVAFSGVVAATAVSATGSVPAGVLCGVAAGGVIGLVNGAAVAGLGINSLIATLATMEVVRGLAYIVSNGDAVIVFDESFFEIGIGSLLGIGYPVIAMTVAFVVFGVVLNYMVFGKEVLAIGGNPSAARLAGIAVRRTRVLVFTLQGLVAGLAGVLLASRLSIGDPKASAGLELAVISACVLGGVSLTGGIATITGVLVGVMIMGCVQNAMSLLNVPTFYQYLVRGGILFLAVAFDRLRSR